MKLVQPVPKTDDLAPDYTRARGDHNYDFAWRAADAQGMYNGPTGGRVHGAVDMFAPGGSAVVAPMSGRVVRSLGGGGVIGQVFGGVLCIESPEGVAVQMRHVNPTVPLGAHVEAGERVATVTDWRDGWPHAHVEVYKRWPAPYDWRYTIDPKTVEWIAEPEGEVVAAFYFEELPHSKGGLGPVVVRRTPSRLARDAAMLKHRALGRIVTPMRDASGDYVALWWLPDTHAAGLPIFGPWAQEDSRDRVRKTREVRTGRVMRPFKGRHRSSYPNPGG